MKIFDGKQYAIELDKSVVSILSKLKESKKDIKKLLIIQIGDNIASTKYVSLKVSYCTKYGIPIEILNIDSSKSNKEIEHIVFENVSRIDVSGVIIQLPLPRQSLKYILDIIPQEKDLDVLSTSLRSNWFNLQEYMYPPIVRAVKLFLAQTIINEKKAIIVGHGFLVGKILKDYLKHLGYEIVIYEKKDKVENLTLKAPLVILATNVPNLVLGNNISQNACVIDFGYSVLNGKTVGNLDLFSQLDHLSLISKSPGGMGPIVIRYLVLNHLERLL